MRRALPVAALATVALVIAGTPPAGSQDEPQEVPAETEGTGPVDGENDPAIDEAIAAYEWPDVAEDRSVLVPGDDPTADRLAAGSAGFGAAEEAVAETVAGTVRRDRYAGQS